VRQGQTGNDLSRVTRQCIREAAPVLKTGRKWSAKKSVEEANLPFKLIISWDRYSMEEGVWAQFSSS